jgi:hypothetical protein
MKIGRLLLLALSEDFLQPLSFDGHSGSRRLSHLLREFQPVLWHEDSVVRSHTFAKNAKG